MTTRAKAIVIIASQAVAVGALAMALSSWADYTRAAERASRLNERWRYMSAILEQTELTEEQLPKELRVSYDPISMKEPVKPGLRIMLWLAVAGIAHLVTFFFAVIAGWPRGRVAAQEPHTD